MTDLHQQQIVSAVAGVYGAVLSGLGLHDGIPALSWTGIIALAGGLYGYAELRGRLKAREEMHDEHTKYVEACLLRLGTKLGVDLSDLKR